MDLIEHFQHEGIGCRMFVERYGVQASALPISVSRDHLYLAGMLSNFPDPSV